MDKLIITCCVHDERCDGFPAETQTYQPRGIRQVADSVRAAHDAGAAAAHIHMPGTKAGAQNAQFIKEDYLEFARLIRQTDVIWEYRGPGPFQCGYAGRKSVNPAEWPAQLRKWREIDVGGEHPDLVNCIIGPQHIDWGGSQVHVMPTLDEIEAHMGYFRDIKIKPYFEVWGANALYNIQHLIRKRLINPPYWLELWLGVPGATTSPANVEELLYFTKKLPEGSLWLTGNSEYPKGSLTPQQMILYIAQAIILGGHVRVGLEGCPYYWDGSLAKSNAQLIESVVRIARDIGREVATSSEAREMLGLPQRK